MSTCEIILSDGSCTVIDAEDYEKVSRYSWHVSEAKTGYKYVCTTVWDRGESKPISRTLRLHRFLLSAPPHLYVDHVNGNSLDNRKSNLRLCTQSQNMMNSRRKKGVKGVHLERRSGTWVARIQCNHTRLYIGAFLSKEAAAFAYDRKARELFGEYACTNFHPDYESAYADMIRDTL